MRKTAREAPRRSAANRNVQEAQVTIRMYKVGFGDCFLLLIPTDAGTKKMLIDCGSLKNHKKKIAEISNRVIEDIRDSDGTPRIDVLVVTHRHADHISALQIPSGARSKWVRCGCRGRNHRQKGGRSDFGKPRHALRRSSINRCCTCIRMQTFWR